MYKFDVFEKAHIEPTPSAVIYGIKEELLHPTAVCDFAEWQITNNRQLKDTDLLVFEGNLEEALSAMKRAGYDDASDGKSMLRYAILYSLDREDENLLEKIESVYSDFGYPQDMESFIYYMPSNEKESSVEKLMANFYAFLKEEKIRLKL